MEARKKSRLNFPLFLFCFLLLASYAYAETPEPEPSPLKIKNEEKKSKVAFDLFFETMSMSGESFPGSGIQGSYFTAVTDKIGFGFLLSQAFLSLESAFFTQLGLEGRWALTGSLIKKGTSLSSGDHSILESRNDNTGGLRLHFFIHQYFINVIKNSVPYPGVGGALSYEIPTSGPLYFRTGGRADWASNNSLSFIAVQIFAGVGLWL